MKMSQIRIESQLALIGVKQSLGSQHIRQPKAEINLQQSKANMSIQSKNARLTIDQTKAFEDANLMSIAKRIKRSAQEGKSKMMQGAQRRAQQGNSLMKIEHGGNPIAQQAKANGHDQMKTLGMKYIPSQLSVKIDYQPAHLQIKAQTNSPKIDARANTVEYQYNRSHVETYMKRYATLEIDFTHIYSQTI